MRLVGNVIWFVFGGAVTALMWIIAGARFALTIIGLPLTRSAFEMAHMSAFPFGKEVVHVREIDGRGLSPTTALTGTVGLVFNILWLVTAGWVLFLSYLVSGILCCLTIIGIPFGIQAFKLAGISLWPVGRRVVTKEFAAEMRRRNAATSLDRLRAA